MKITRSIIGILMLLAMVSLPVSTVYQQSSEQESEAQSDDCRITVTLVALGEIKDQLKSWDIDLEIKVGPIAGEELLPKQLIKISPSMKDWFHDNAPNIVFTRTYRDTQLSNQSRISLRLIAEKVDDTSGAISQPIRSAKERSSIYSCMRFSTPRPMNRQGIITLRKDDVIMGDFLYLVTNNPVGFSRVPSEYVEH